jgi:hypothetical protein
MQLAVGASLDGIPRIEAQTVERSLAAATRRHDCNRPVRKINRSCDLTPRVATQAGNREKRKCQVWFTHASSQELSIVVFVASPAATTVIIAIIIVVIVVIPTPLPRSIPGDHALFHGRAARSLPDRRAGCRTDSGSDHSAVPAA